MSDQQCRYILTIEVAKGRVADRKDFLSIVNSPFSDVLPPPHLEHHQAYLLCSGYNCTFKKLETMLLGMECFPFLVIDAITKLLHTLFKAKLTPKTGSKIPLVPLIPEKLVNYDLPNTFLDICPM